MLDFNHHYKLRHPQNTINIIQSFFNNKGYNIKLAKNYHSEINTYSCSYELYYQNEFILSANGKGMTSLYSKASCYAEMYERFCAYRFSNLLNPINNNFIRYNNLKKYSYNYYPNEKLLSLDDLKQDPYFLKIFNYYLPEINDKYIQQFINIFFNGEVYGYPYQNIFNINDIKYFNLNISSYVNDTTGFAAGNTIEEALVQGISEMYERICVEKFFTDIQKKYFYLNESFFNKNIQNLIQNIKSLGYKVKIYDLSYNFNLPVCFTIIYNLNKGIFQYNFGSFPILDIAVERTLTELYQGLTTLPNNTNLIYNYNIKYAAQKSYMSSLGQNINDIYIIPDYIFNDEQVNPNNKIFYFSSIIDNYSVLLKQIEYINKINNFNFYFLDISLSNKIKAISILSDKIERPQASIYKFNTLINFNAKEKIDILNILEYIKNEIFQLIQLQSKEFITYNITQKFLMNLLLLFQFTGQHPITILNNNSQLNFFILYLIYPFMLYIKRLGDEKNIFYLLMDKNNNIVRFNYFSNYRNKYNQYLLNNTQLNNSLFITNNDNLSFKDNIELFKFIYLDTLYDYYNSNLYKNFILTFI